jgi:TPR repeat protein
MTENRLYHISENFAALRQYLTVRALNILILLFLPLFFAPLRGADDDDETAVDTDELRRQAVAGDVSAQIELAGQYFSGKGRPKNYNLAARWFRKAAAKDVPAAVCNLGVCYERGLGVKKNLYEAFKLYSRAAELGVSHAKYNMALILTRGIPADEDLKTPAVPADRKKAAEIFSELCRGDFHPAFREHALFLLSGERMSSAAVREAFSLLERSAQNGDAASARLLSGFYKDGKWKKPDPEKSMKYLRDAVSLGDARAMLELGDMTAKGAEGAEKNPEKAFLLYREAAAKGLPQAMGKAADCLFDGTGCKKDQMESLDYYKKGAQARDPWCLYKLGRWTIELQDSGEEPGKAGDMIMDAAALGCADAQYMVACLMEEGRMYDRDYQSSFHWLKKAAAQNHAGAQRKLGFYYILGAGTEKDRAEGIKWFEKAAANGDADAKDFLDKAQKGQSVTPEKQTP